MTASVSQKPEALFWGFLSWQFAVALVSIGLFWFSIIRPDSVPMVGDNKSTAGLCAASFLEEIKKSEPLELLRQGKNEEAVAAAKAALAKSPYDTKTVVVAGNVFCVAGNKEEGIALLRKSTFLCPQSRYVSLNFARNLALVGQRDEAEHRYFDLGQNFPNEWATPRLELAEMQIQDKAPEAAMDRLKEVIAADPKNGYAHRQLGLAMAAKGDSKPGFEEFVKGCALESEQGPPPELKAFIEKIGNSAKAEETLKKTLQTTPGDPKATVRLAQLLVDSNRLAEAKNLLKFPLDQKENPIYKMAEAHFIMADLNNQEGNTEDALMEFRRGAKIIMGN